MRWWESVEKALDNLGGSAPLRLIYNEVRRIRTEQNLSTPVSLEEVVRKELEYNSSDSSNWRRTRDIFFSVDGIGAGRWGTRKGLSKKVEANDLEVAAAPRIEQTVLRIIRDTALARKIKVLNNNLCQICGSSIKLPDGSYYSEAHHIIPLGRPHNGPDAAENIIVVCPNHHAMLDLGCIRIEHSEPVSPSGHRVSQKSIDYHNSVLFGKTDITE